MSGARYIAIRSDQWRALFATIGIIPSLTALSPAAGQQLAERLAKLLQPVARRAGSRGVRIAEAEFDRAIAAWTIEAHAAIERA
ncbi:MAG: hypothetical protein ACREQI_07855, partial [Candidatus Binataceae bacterium]